VIPAENERRPWTVQVLVALGTLGLALNIIMDGERETGDLAGFAISAWIIVGFWRGRQWAFVFAFGGWLLSLITLVIHLFSAPSERPPVLGLWFAMTIVWIFLPWHPKTRAFASPPAMEEKIEPKSRAEMIHFAATSVFAILALIVPVLWALGTLKGVVLYVLVTITVGLGVVALRPYTRPISGAPD
jgi:hypothetical protein